MWRLIPDISGSTWATSTFVRSCLCLAFLLVYPVAWNQLKIEKASASSGSIRSDHPIAYTPRLLEIGNSGVTYNWTDNDNNLNYKSLGGFYDFGIRLDSGADGLEISTVMRDRTGRLLAKIDKNHWTVPAGIEKNYTNDSLEVLDGGEHVAIQIHMLPDRIQLRGEWHNELGEGMQIGECKSPQISNTVGCVIFWPSLEEEIRLKKHFIEPIFKYPASEHFGELKSQTN